MTKVTPKGKLVYADLTFKIIGVLFDVFNTLGYGYKEIYYQRALARGFKEAGFKFQEQVSVPVLYKGERIGIHRFDFLLEDKVVLEIKQGDHFARPHIQQLYGYLVSKNLAVGLLVYFSSRGLKFKRIVNL